MKKSMLFIMVMLISAVGLNAQSQVTSKAQSNAATEEVKNGPKAEWDQQIADLGDVPFRQSTPAEYVLTNTGNEPLLITSARASCGCTNLKYSQEPILPGQSATLSVTFNGTGNGPFRKSITVNTNADERPTILQIKGTVIRE
jgi:hypothetical protein